MGSEFPAFQHHSACSYHLARARKKIVHSFDPNSQALFASLPFSLPHTLSLLPSVHYSFAHVDAPKPPAEDHFIMPDEFEMPGGEAAGRTKRSPINTNRVGGLNVETLVVADKKMLEKHGRDNVTTYVLTVMNMVSLGEGNKDLAEQDHF